MKKVILVTIGFAFLIFGTIGLVIPIMPTTPFVLIAAGCFAKSSPRLHNKLLNTKYLGDFVVNYQNKTGVEAKVKKTAIGFLWVTLIVSALVFKSWLVMSILLMVGIAVTIHIATIKTKVVERVFESEPTEVGQI